MSESEEVTTVNNTFNISATDITAIEIKAFKQGYSSAHFMIGYNDFADAIIREINLKIINGEIPKPANYEEIYNLF